MSQKSPSWALRLNEDNTYAVRHIESRMRVGNDMTHREAEFVVARLNKELPDYDMRAVKLEHAEVIRNILESALAERPRRKLSKYVAVVTVRVPLWSETEEEARTVIQEMLDSDELFSYTDEFVPTLEVSTLVNEEEKYNDPVYVVVRGGIEEVERVPFIPVDAAAADST